MIAESAISEVAATERPSVAPSSMKLSAALESPLASTSVESFVLNTLKPARKA